VHTSRWDDNIKIYHKSTECVVWTGFICSAQGSENTVVNLRVPYNSENFWLAERLLAVSCISHVINNWIRVGLRSLNTSSCTRAVPSSNPFWDWLTWLILFAVFLHPNPRLYPKIYHDHFLPHSSPFIVQFRPSYLIRSHFISEVDAVLQSKQKSITSHAVCFKWDWKRTAYHKPVHLHQQYICIHVVVTLIDMSENLIFWQYLIHLKLTNFVRSKRFSDWKRTADFSPHLLATVSDGPIWLKFKFVP